MCVAPRMESLIRDFTCRRGVVSAIVEECIAQGVVLKTQISYVIATVEHETRETFKPVIEAFWLPDPDSYLKKHHPEYYPYYGRGFVQLTWKKNYEKYGRLLGQDLLKSPELALEPNSALFVLVHGFRTGAFTGRPINHYIDEIRTDFYNARRCINGIDRAKDIEALAIKHLNDQTNCW